ncbi:L-type lectin-domain containing receptor kinase IX.1-like [Aristolochia californica]|uniref:L-type lectin-domain containing receptor kinase IX.1-like n=1 Tax=Aristolochia californica TaxID=171875 RepID=UPI0035DD93C4
MIFNFTSFAPNAHDIIFSGDAFASGEKVIQLTRNQLDQDLLQSAGRITYASPIQIWDPATRVVADFCTQFKFVIDGLDKEKYGDGLAFFMAPVGSDLPQNSTGQWLGLFNSTTNGMASTQVVAVEFDTFQNRWDPSPNHIGIDINSIISVTTKNWETEIRNGSAGSAWVGYNSTTRSLYAFLTYDKWSFAGKPSISYEVNLTDFLPDKIVIGFSASTGASTELHKILSWNFQSSMTLGSDTHRSGNKRRQWVILLVVTMGVLVAALGFAWIVWRREKRQCRDDTVLDASIEDKFVKGTVPRRFTYKELALATKNFSEEGKLGQGGFGGVYKGTLSNNSTAFETVAVKKIARGSKQGRKEYVTEVTVISRLRHRNLVKLIGWCHEYGEFLLVYECMPNGSLDSYLFGKKLSLKWKVRYKIALGLASALLYLHEEWEQCVIHRDIKSSNIMLDSNFNTKLGDFGLARFIDHELGSQSTVVAGTMGYLAPECITTGKASKESDVYSFGVVALEIACGRKPVDTRADERKVRLVEWVWDLYGKGKLFEAVDERLSNDFDEKQMERLMTVGLCCVHPDIKLRPSIRQVIQVLNVEAPLPSLPAKMPVAIYYAPPFSMSHFNYTSNMSITNWTTGGSHSSCNTSSTASSRASSTKSLLEKSKVETNQPSLLGSQNEYDANESSKCCS